MSNQQASQIPDLRTLLPSRGRGGLRGRAHARDAPSAMPQRFEPEEASPQAKDAIVQRTDQDAASSRMSAVDLGYLNDPFSKYFMTGPIPRRFPIMNRGTYVRTTAIDTLLDSFLQQDPDQVKQIISLGAGTDTRYFRLLERKATRNLIYHEIDFPRNTGNKIATIQRTPALLSRVQAALERPEDLIISVDATSLTSPRYNIHPLDLRHLKTTQVPGLSNISATMPTLVLSECCLIYLTPTDAVDSLRAIVEKLVPPPTPVAIILYEPIRPNDSFGRTMISNLATRGIVLETLHRYPTLSAQRQRFRDAGFDGGQRVADTDFLWREWIEEGEKDRVSKVEMMDEVEEWTLLARHYCVAWSWREPDTNPIFSKAWGGFPEQHGD